MESELTILVKGDPILVGILRATDGHIFVPKNMPRTAHGLHSLFPLVNHGAMHVCRSPSKQQVGWCVDDKDRNFYICI